MIFVWISQLLAHSLLINRQNQNRESETVPFPAKNKLEFGE
jgi:hypothetical protein